MPLYVFNQSKEKHKTKEKTFRGKDVPTTLNADWDHANLVF
jgi:hypothetical protein